MKKRAISLLFASALAAACFNCGCGEATNDSIIILDDGRSSARETALTVYGHRADRYSVGVTEDALQSFMSVHPEINANYESADGLTYWRALDKRIATDNLDDLFMTDRDRLINLTKSDALSPLSNSVNIDAFNDFTRGQLYINGEIYAVPAAISTYGLYVNYDVLERHRQDVPKTLSQFMAACDYFASVGATPVTCDNHFSLRSLILARGLHETYDRADAADEIARFNRDADALAEALYGGVDLAKKMLEKGYIDATEAASASPDDAVARFATGERPFMLTYGGLSSALKKKNENLRYGVYPLPVLEAGSVLVAQTDCLLSVKRGANAEAAKKLLAALTSPETLLRLNDGQSCFSPLKGQTQIYSDSAVIPQASYLTKGKYVIGSDINLIYPLDCYLTECGKLMLSGNKDVKARLLSLLKGAQK